MRILALNSATDSVKFVYDIRHKVAEVVFPDPSHVAGSKRKIPTCYLEWVTHVLYDVYSARKCWCGFNINTARCNESFYFLWARERFRILCDWQTPLRITLITRGLKRDNMINHDVLCAHTDVEILINELRPKS